MSLYSAIIASLCANLAAVELERFHGKALNHQAIDDGIRKHVHTDAELWHQASDIWKDYSRQREVKKIWSFTFMLKREAVFFYIDKTARKKSWPPFCA